MKRWIPFFLLAFPSAVRKQYKLVLLSCLLFYGPLIVIGLLTYNHPEMSYSIFDSAQLAQYEAMYDPSAEHIGRERQSDSDLASFGFYIRNNIGVGFQMFAAGILLGIGSVFFLVFNGIVIGAIAGHLTQLNYISTFYGFVIGHSAFELTALVLAGAAGLQLGFALLKPAPYPRSVALSRAARKAIEIIYGVIVMLVIAAFIEAYWSSKSTLAPPIKYSVGALLWTVVISYFAWMGHHREP